MFRFYNSRKHTKTYWAHFVISIFITYIPLNFWSKSEKSDDTPSRLYRKAGFFFIIFQEISHEKDIIFPNLPINFSLLFWPNVHKVTRIIHLERAHNFTKT